MREVTVAAVADVPTTGSLAGDLLRWATDQPSKVLLRRRRPGGGGWTDVTAAEFDAQVGAVAKGLMAAGVDAGDRIAIMAPTCFEWTLFDYACWYAAAVPVPIYDTSSAEQVEWIVTNAGVTGLVLGSAKHRAVYEEVEDRVRVSRLWTLDEGAVEELVALGESVTDAALQERREQRRPEDVATIIYTSGTTGRPKGCTLTHANFMADVRNVVDSMPELFYGTGASTLLFLPLAHVFGRLIEVGCIYSGTVLGHSSDIKSILGDLAAFRPSFLLAVPRVFEKVYNGAEQKATSEGKGRIFGLAASAAVDFSRAQDRGGPGWTLRLRHGLFDRLVYRKLRAAMGGRVLYAVSGGAPLGERLGHFFRGVGVTILEGYGLTETTGASTLNRPGEMRIGSVGRPIPSTSVRIADDGEVELAGPQIFTGYWRNPEATAEAMGGEWFRTGDVGELDADGYLRITGRKKELIVTAGGKNVAPAVLEDRLRAHFLISQCMVVGDGQPYIAALITIDAEALAAWSGLAGLPAGMTLTEAANHPAVHAEVAAAVDDANKAVSRAEAIRKFEILHSDWTEEGGQLTPSLKLKRQVVLAECADEVAALYA